MTIPQALGLPYVADDSRPETTSSIPQPASDVQGRLELLTRLYAEQAALGEVDEQGYLQAHGQPIAVLHHVNVFEWYAPRLQANSTVLDWGCNHGPDSCLLRHRFGDSLNLHACDFVADETFAAFRSYARAAYTRLTEPLTIPYSSATFDAVIGSGTLEHTAMDGQSLKELYRVLKPNGLLIITFLPYAYSLDEWRQRSRGVDFHRRLYTRYGLARFLLSHGFVPETIELQGFVHNHFRVYRKRPLWWRIMLPPFIPLIHALWEPVLRPVLFPFYRQSVLCCVARKAQVM